MNRSQSEVKRFSEEEVAEGREAEQSAMLSLQRKMVERKRKALEIGRREAAQ